MSIIPAKVDKGNQMEGRLSKLQILSGRKMNNSIDPVFKSI